MPTGPTPEQTELFAAIGLAVVGITEAFKQAGMDSRFAPLCAITLSIILVALVAVFPPAMIVVLGLDAVGIFKLTKNVGGK